MPVMLGFDWLQLYLTVRMTVRVKLNVSVCVIILTVGTFLLTFHQTNLSASEDLTVDNSLSDVKDNNHHRKVFKGTEILNELNGEDINTIYYDINNFYVRR